MTLYGVKIRDVNTHPRKNKTDKRTQHQETQLIVRYASNVHLRQIYND